MLNKVIGNTPMVKITYEYLNKINTIYAKLEMFNLTGSIKDRVAYYMIKEGLKEEKLKKGMKIVEVTSGNTGISLSAIGSLMGYPIYIFMPDWASEERKKIMQSYNAKLILVSKKEGGFLACLKKAKEFALQNNAFYPDQFSNRANFLAHYETTAPEILKQLDQNVGGFVSGVGTGGTLMGIGTYLKENIQNLVIGAIEPSSMPLISTGENNGPHQIEGIGDDFIPELIDKNKIDYYFAISDDEALEMSRILAKKGLGVGISSGANFIGSVLLGKKINQPIVTVFADDNKKYLTTNLLKINNNNKNLIANQIKIINIEFIK